MKTLFLFTLAFLSVFGLGQGVDTAGVVREVDSLIDHADSLRIAGKFREAMLIGEDAKKVAESKLGEMHPKYARSVNFIGACYGSMGYYLKAEPFVLNAKAIQEKILGKEHSDYIRSLCNLAALYWEMGRYEAAEPLYWEAKSVGENLLKKKNERTNHVQSLDDLASLFYRLGRYKDAEPLYLKAKSIRQKELGKKHLYYAKSLDNLATLYMQMGRYKIAEPLYLEAKNIYEKKQGKARFDYANNLTNLASLYVQMGRYKIAEPLYLEAKAIWEKAQSKEHPNYPLVLYNLATLYWRMGRFKATGPLFLEIKTIREKILGKEHPDYANSLDNLADFYLQMGQFKSADTLYREAIAIREKVLGKEHPDYAVSLCNLVNLYWNYLIRSWRDDEQIYREAKFILVNASLFGKKHPDYATRLDVLADAARQLNTYDDAEQIYIEAKAIREMIFGKEHPDYAKSLIKLAEFYWNRDMVSENIDFSHIEQLYLEAKTIQERMLGKEHPDYIKSLNGLAALHFRIDWERFYETELKDGDEDDKLYMVNLENYIKIIDIENVEHLYLEVKQIQEKVFGKENIEYAMTLSNLSSVYWQIKKSEDALQLYLEAKAITIGLTEKEYPTYANYLDNLAVLSWNLSRLEDTEYFYEEAKTIRKKVLDKGHPDNEKSLENLRNFYLQTGRYERAEPFILEDVLDMRNKLYNISLFATQEEMNEIIEGAANYLYREISLSLIKTGITPEFSISSFDNALFYKGFLLTAVNQMRRLALSDSISARQFIMWTDCLRRLGTEYTKPSNEREGVEYLEKVADSLERDLKRIVTGFGEFIRQVSWKEVQAAIGSDEAAIEFVSFSPDFTLNLTDTFPTFYCALVLRPGDTTPLFVPLFEERALKSILPGAADLHDGTINNLYTFPEGERLKSLYELIWKPLEGLLQGVKTVYCSPSGLLHRLNLGAIPIDSGRVFTDQYRLVTMSSTRQLVIPDTAARIGNNAYLIGGVRYETDSTAMFAARSKIGRSGTERRSLLDEAPFYPEESLQRDSLGYLPGTLTEVLDIRRTLQVANLTVQLDTGFQASEESFRELDKYGASPRNIHIATHGYFFPDLIDVIRADEPVFRTSEHPLLRSGLILAGAQQAWETGKGLSNRDDGILTAYEISQMNLSNTELVVLSACETGLGDIEGNEGVYGLQRAFKIAGAKYLIMSLWKVNDLTTSELMTDFYNQWLEKGLSIPDAFRSAQSNMKAKYPNDPYLWAGFILIE